MPKLRKPPTLKRELGAWRVMRYRCLSPTHKDFRHYGGKLITICPEWLQSFTNFLADLGPAPSQTYWLGRLDVTKGYCPENCHWTTHDPQIRRRTCTRMVTFNGQELTLSELARKVGVDFVTLSRRLSNYQCNLTEATTLNRLTRKNEQMLTHQGVTLRLAQWASAIGISRVRLWSRLKQGWTTDHALTEPVRKQAKPSPKPLLE